MAALADVGHCQRSEQDDHQASAHDADGDPEDEVVALGALEALEAVHLTSQVALRVVQLGSQVHPEHSQQLTPRLGSGLRLRLGVLDPRRGARVTLGLGRRRGLEPECRLGHGARLGVE